MCKQLPWCRDLAWQGRRGAARTVPCASTAACMWLFSCLPSRHELRGGGIKLCVTLLWLFLRVWVCSVTLVVLSSLAGRLNQEKQQFSPCSEERDLEQYGSTKHESNRKNLRKTMQLLFLFLPLIFQASGVYEIVWHSGTRSAGTGDKQACFRWWVLWLSKVTRVTPGAARACPSLSSSIRQKQIVLCLLSSPSWHPHVPEHCPCCPSPQPCANE